MSELVIDVRQAKASDARGIAEVHDAAWRDAYQGIIPALTLEKMIGRRSLSWWVDAARRRKVLVLDVGGKVVGYATFGLARMHGSAGAGEIQEIYVTPVYQGIGLGGRLFHAACAALRAQKFTILIVRALSDNDRAMCFYQRQGGRLVARGTEKLGDATLPTAVFQWRLVQKRSAGR